MTEKIAITYIGNKPSKPDTICSSRLVFPRGKSVEVDSDLAYRFLDYPTVWVLSSDAEKVLADQDEKIARIAKAKDDEAAAAALKTVELSMSVMIDGVETDISKYSKNQLATLVEAQDLTELFDFPKNPVPTYRLAIRNALRLKIVK